MENLKLHNIIDKSTQYGVGQRAVVVIQGSPHENFDSIDQSIRVFDGGYETTVMEVVDSIRAIQKLSGVSLAGGEPFCQAEACSSLAHVLRLDKYTVWCFTGFDLSHLIEVSKFNRPVRNLLQCIDVLVCGIFDSEKKVNNVGFDFSVNQKVYKIKKGKVTSELTNADLIAMQLKSSKRKKSSKLVADELVVDNTSAVVDDTPLTAASC